MIDLDRNGQNLLAGHRRLRLVSAAVMAAFMVIVAKAGLIVATSGDGDGRSGAHDYATLPRPDIVDRNGVLLASDIRVASLFANPRKIIDVDEAIELLTAVAPDLDQRELRDKLTRDKAFVWLKREVSPSLQTAIHNQGIPGVGFRYETRRIYPKKGLAAHVLGFVNVDSRGIAGLEKFLDGKGKLYATSLNDPATSSALPARVSLDARVQFALDDELAVAMTRFKAKAAAGVVMDADTGEVLALVSLPRFDPNYPAQTLDKETRLNRITAGVYELGSVIKPVTFAMALDGGVTTLQGSYDARFPLVVGRSKIHDFHAQKRILTVPEIFQHSSNIGTARMALDVGEERHRAFLKKVGFFSRLRTELPETARPIIPRRWTRLTTATAAFGHGFAIQPLQGVAVAAALINGGWLMTPTFVPRDRETARAGARAIISPATSEKMRYLFRLNALKGTARRANVPGYRVGGKTGTAEKVVNGRYSADHRLTSFIGAFPMDAPRYVLFVMLDEPQPVEGSNGYATSGWNAVPTAGKVVARIAPLLGVVPRLDEAERVKLAAARKKRESAER